MKTLQKTNLDLSLLASELDTLAYVLESDYIEMAVSQSDDHLLRFPQIAKAVEEIASLRKLNPAYVMVNRLLPGHETPWHQDYLKPTPLQPYPHPLIERWHLPVATNDLCWFEEKNNGPYTQRFPLGMWCGPVPYWNHHRVLNLGSSLRVHLIVDLDTPEPMGRYEH